MKKLIVFFLLISGISNIAQAQFIVAAPDVTASVGVQTGLMEAQYFNTIVNNAYERAIDQAELSAVAAKLEVANEEKAVIKQENFLTELEKVNVMINLVTNQLEKGTIVANAIQALSFVEGTVTGSMKLAQVFKLQDKIISTLNQARDSTLNAVYPGISTITTNAPITTTTITNNTTFTTTYSGKVFTASEQADVQGQLDMFAENLKWQMFDVSNVITQTVTFTASSADRYKLISGVYENVYKVYQDARKYLVNINQTIWFRKLQASARGIGPGTNISF